MSEDNTDEKGVSSVHVYFPPLSRQKFVFFKVETGDRCIAFESISTLQCTD